MNTTSIIGEAVGIQRQALIDRSEAQRNEGLTSALIIGQFRRGRVDQPMTIHQGNIRGQLGHDPLNPDYIAVQACLDTGVPSVQVLRVGKLSQQPEITCEQSIPYVVLVNPNYCSGWELKWEGGLIGNEAVAPWDASNQMDNIIEKINNSESGLTASYGSIDNALVITSNLPTQRFTFTRFNRGVPTEEGYVEIVEPALTPGIDSQHPEYNPTFTIQHIPMGSILGTGEIVEVGYWTSSFCLTPSISCEGASPTYYSAQNYWNEFGLFTVVINGQDYHSSGSGSFNNQFGQIIADNDLYDQIAFTMGSGSYTDWRVTNLTQNCMTFQLRVQSSTGGDAIVDVILGKQL